MQYLENEQQQQQKKYIEICHFGGNVYENYVQDYVIVSVGLFPLQSKERLKQLELRRCLSAG